MDYKEKVIALLNDKELSSEQKEKLESIFPELKESEDERIRKRLIEFFEDWGETKSHCWGKSVNKILAWLEKQGEQKPKDKYTFKSIPRLLDMIEPTDRAKSYCKKLIDSLQTEGYVTDAKIVSDCLKQMNGEKVAMATMDEQKPTWSDVDEMVLEDIEEAIINYWHGDTKIFLLDWLKSLKERLKNE